MSRLPYEIVDVFTDRPFTGNPLAVVFDAPDLAASQFQALAREFHLSETVFILPPTRDGASYRARIFTPEAELPFAGHPSVGAAATVVRRGLFGPGRLVQECGAGLLPIDASADRATLTGGDPTVGPERDTAAPLALVGLGAADHAGPAVRLAGCGLDFVYLPVRQEVLAGAGLGHRAVDLIAADPDLGRISVVAWDPDERAARVRVFAPGVGVPEDPATGSAALGLGVWLVASGLLPGEGTSGYTVRQGAELHRPSILDCTVTAAGGVAVGATVSGHVVSVAGGAIAVPPFIG